MDNNDNDSNKTTIRVKLSDDDYTDIIFDWTKEKFELNGSIFHKLSSFTGINVEHVLDLCFIRNDGMDYMTNPDNKRQIELDNIFFRTITKNEFLRDGDCYRLQAALSIRPTLDGIIVHYYLCSQEIINETECNEVFCHVRGSRLFTDRLAKVANSNSINSYIGAIPDRPRPNIQHGVFYVDDDYRAGYSRLIIKLVKDLDIGLVLHNFCAAGYMGGIFLWSHHKPRLYSPNRG